MLGDITTADAIYIICGATDMRKSIDGLCAVIKDQLDLFSSQSDEDEKAVVTVEPEFFEVKAHTRERK